MSVTSVFVFHGNRREATMGIGSSSTSTSRMISKVANPWDETSTLRHRDG